MTASEIEMGYLLGVSHAGNTHTELHLPVLLCYYYYFSDRSAKPQIFSCSPLVIHRAAAARRRRDGCYFPSSSSDNLWGKPGDVYLQLPNRMQVGVHIKVIKTKFPKVTQAAPNYRYQRQNGFTGREMNRGKKDKRRRQRGSESRQSINK